MCVAFIMATLVMDHRLLTGLPVTKAFKSVASFHTKSLSMRPDMTTYNHKECWLRLHAFVQVAEDLNLRFLFP